MYLSVSTIGYFRGQVTCHLSQAFIAITDPRDVVGSVDGWIQAAPRTDRVMACLARGISD
jgi:hypothetical protein